MAETLKHRWSLGHNYLTGITLGRWWRLLRENRFAVDPAYWHRAAFLSAMSCFNSAGAAIERLRYGRRVRATEISRPPLFVLGHWRSGTTHLHNLLAMDTKQFAYANTYEVVSPFTFLTTQGINTRLFRWMVPSKRPMDDMALSFGSPQEDELALAMMSLRSMYFTITFPRREAHYARYLTFDGVPPEDVEAWRRALVDFARKLTFAHGRALLLKSPCHTARIGILLETFPDARFIHIHRDPYTVFLSSRRYFDTAAWYTYLQRPDRTQLDDQIIERYARLYDAFFEQQPLIPPGRFHELAFDELERGPVGAMGRAYEALSLEGFDAVEPEIRRYTASLAGYRKNRHPELPGDLRRRIAEAWRRSFDRFGYET